MTLKLNRNTRKASAIHSEKARQRRVRMLDEIRQKIFEELCKCGKCKRGDYSDLCLSYWRIAKEANALNIKTSSGKVGTWQVTTVANLFKAGTGRNIFMVLDEIS